MGIESEELNKEYKIVKLTDQEEFFKKFTGCWIDKSRNMVLKIDFNELLLGVWQSDACSYDKFEIKSINVENNAVIINIKQIRSWNIIEETDIDYKLILRQDGILELIYLEKNNIQYFTRNNDNNYAQFNEQDTIVR